MDLLAGRPPPVPSPGAPKEAWGFLMFDDIWMIHRTCLAPILAQEVAVSYPRPAVAPGVQTVTADANFTQAGCSTDPAAPAITRCYPLALIYDNFVLYGANADSYGKPQQTGYVVWLRETRVKCETVLEVDCVARLGSLGCFYSLFPKRGNGTQGLQQPPPPPGAANGLLDGAPQPADQAAAGQGEAGDDSQVVLGAVLGAVLGGVALLAIAAVIVVRIRQQRARSQGTAEVDAAPPKTSDPGFKPSPGSAQEDVEKGASPPAPGFAAARVNGGVAVRPIDKDKLVEARCSGMSDPSSKSRARSRQLTSDVHEAMIASELIPDPITAKTPMQPHIDLDLHLGPEAVQAVGGKLAPVSRQPTSTDRASSTSLNGGSDAGRPPAKGEVTLLPVVLGKGTFGRVVEGVWNEQRVAVKLLNLGLLADEQQQEKHLALVGAAVTAAGKGAALPVEGVAMGSAEAERQGRHAGAEAWESLMQLLSVASGLTPFQLETHAGHAKVEVAGSTHAPATVSTAACSAASSVAALLEATSDHPSGVAVPVAMAVAPKGVAASPTSGAPATVSGTMTGVTQASTSAALNSAAVGTSTQENTQPALEPQGHGQAHALGLDQVDLESGSRVRDLAPSTSATPPSGVSTYPPKLPVEGAGCSPINDDVAPAQRLSASESVVRQAECALAMPDCTKLMAVNEITAASASSGHDLGQAVTSRSLSDVGSTGAGSGAPANRALQRTGASLHGEAWSPMVHIRPDSVPETPDIVGPDLEGGENARGESAAKDASEEAEKGAGPVNEEEAAARKANKRDALEAALRRTFLAEVEVLARIEHPNIVRLLAACVKPPQMCLVMERMDTSLDRVLYGRGPDGARKLLPLGTVVHIAMQVCSALAYLHPTIIHRDLKPGNVLLSNIDSPTPTVKLADFGLSRLQSTIRITRNADAGTASYMAPETLNPYNLTISHHVDMYALGIIVWEMLAGRRPWEGMGLVQVAFAVASQQQRPNIADIDPDRCPPRLRKLVEGCWEADPRRRPAASEAAKELLLLQKMSLEV
ncbi:hypothetical protein HYH03_016405 [Edaphochlamys debaryana]|uniref:Protein kinase domain-containing protein n=1 Tax=Edaphochlamys debaryana TaxID=47281 RepID=A0A836BRI0_9CHLO|nr:hypothetical protein HYH03_016405 [Edaphochlamys debaryana]|eukprot:KAG2484839.1 hypothetical protein HYH03_016405 [Edaphochlamys debaryana]